MKTAYRLVNILRVAGRGSSERDELLGAFYREHHEPMLHFGGMEVRAQGEHDGYCTYKANVVAFADDSMILMLARDDGAPPRAHPFDLDNPDDALRATGLLGKTQLGPPMMAYLTRALERNVDWRIDWLNPRDGEQT